jgi:GDPmannose 4,6-dehydratase
MILEKIKNKILVIGAAGQLGYFLCKHLHKKNNIFFTASRQGWPVLGSCGDLSIDISSDFEIRQFCKKEKINRVVILAARCMPGQQNDSKFETYRHNIQFIERLLSELKGTDVSGIFFASSREIFGTEPGLFNELSAANPQSYYAESKVIGELLLNQFSSDFGVEVATGIFFNQESGRRKNGFAMELVLGAKQLLQTNDRRLVMNFNFEKDWCHAYDGARAIFQIMQLPKAERFIISSGISRTAKEFAENVVNYFDLEDVKIVFREPGLRLGQLGDNSKLKKTLGWHPKADFETTVATICEEFKNGTF